MATQNAINNTIQNPTITGSVTLSSLTANTAVILDASKALASSATTSTELGYLSGVTSSVQTQLNSKANLTGGNTFGGTQIFSSATAYTVPYFDGTKALTSSAVTSTELGYLSGVTSSIQTQLNAKAGTSSPSFTGTVGVDGRLVLSGTTIGALYVEANSIQTGGYCAYFISNSTDTGARNLVLCQNSNSLATGTVTLNVQQFAANYAMVVQGYANGVLYYLNGAGNTTTNMAEFSCNTLTTGSIMSLYSQSTDTSSRPLFWIRQNSSAATGTTGIQIDHISSGYCMKISQSVNNANACYGLQMNIANAGAGLEYAFRFDGSEIVASAVGGSQNKKVQVSVAGTNYYIPLYTA